MEWSWCLLGFRSKGMSRLGNLIAFALGSRTKNEAGNEVLVQDLFKGRTREVAELTWVKEGTDFLRNLFLEGLFRKASPQGVSLFVGRHAPAVHAQRSANTTLAMRVTPRPKSRKKVRKQPVKSKLSFLVGAVSSVTVVSRVPIAVDRRRVGCGCARTARRQ